ncbi:unnamed protein product [Prorocentrum cordatum]|uniref:Tyr recombinase domain-containing protein n=1 Tax=Prorocentrum cordatum TaxID=2364126 RepID=A0ABN9TWF5_9DINO|nr:unnamed protein product [Polarella glacialis]
MVQSFVSWIRAHGIDVATDLEQLDFQLCEWIETLWAHGRPAGDAGATLSGVQFFLRRKRVFHSAWNLLKAWQRTEMPQRAPPMPEYVLMSLATVARSWSRNDIAVLLVIGYSVFLRTMELLTLRKWQLQFSNDGLSLVIALPVTKAGKRRHCEESVTLHDARIVHFIKVLTQHLPPESSLLQGTVPEFRDVFKALLRLDEGLLVTAVNAHTWGTFKSYLTTSRLLEYLEVEKVFLREFACVYVMAFAFLKLGAVTVKEGMGFFLFFRVGAAVAGCALLPDCDPELLSDLGDLIAQVALAVSAARATDASGSRKEWAPGKSIDFDAYVGDLSLSCAGAAKVVVAALAAGANAPRQVIAGTLECKFGGSRRGAVLGSSRGRVDLSVLPTAQMGRQQAPQKALGRARPAAAAAQAPATAQTRAAQPAAAAAAAPAPEHPPPPAPAAGCARPPPPELGTMERARPHQRGLLTGRLRGLLRGALRRTKRPAGRLRPARGASGPPPAKRRRAAPLFNPFGDGEAAPPPAGAAALGDSPAAGEVALAPVGVANFLQGYSDGSDEEDEVAVAVVADSDEEAAEEQRDAGAESEDDYDPFDVVPEEPEAAARAPHEVDKNDEGLDVGEGGG